MNRYDFYNICLKDIETEYILNTKITDTFDPEYSNIIIEYFNNNPNCDLGLSSFYTSINNESNLILKNYEKDMLFLKNGLNNLDLEISKDNMIFWRKSINNIFNIPVNEKFIEKCININLNFMCISSKPLYVNNNII